MGDHCTKELVVVEPNRDCQTFRWRRRRCQLECLATTAVEWWTNRCCLSLTPKSAVSMEAMLCPCVHHPFDSNPKKSTHHRHQDHRHHHPRDNITHEWRRLVRIVGETTTTNQTILSTVLQLRSENKVKSLCSLRRQKERKQAAPRARQIEQRQQEAKTVGSSFAFVACRIHIFDRKDYFHFSVLCLDIFDSWILCYRKG
jgi:hypothetical protein